MKRLFLPLIGVAFVAFAGFVSSGCECGQETTEPGAGEEGGGGESIPPGHVKISGQLTNQINSYWKVKITSSSPATNIYVSPSSSGSFYSYVPTNGTYAIIAFLDLNKNGVLDSGFAAEPSTTEVVGGRVVLSNLNTNASITLNAAVMGQSPGVGITNYVITGTLSNYSSGWKVKAEDVNFNVSYYAVVDSSGDYKMYLPYGDYRIFAFRDDNDNIVYDSSVELKVYGWDETNVSGDLSGMDIDIPNLTNITVSGTISGNIYGKRIGAFVKVAGKVFSSASSSDSSFSYSVNLLEVPPNSTGEIGIYVDKDEDGVYDRESVGEKVVYMEASSWSPVEVVFSTNMTVNMELVPRVIKGTANVVSGDGSHLKLITAIVSTNENPNDDVCAVAMVPYTGGAYSMEFYLVTNDYSAGTFNAFMYVSEDSDNDGFFDKEDPYAAHVSNTNTGIDISSGITNSGVDMYINEAEASGTVSGEGEGTVYSSFVCMIPDSDSEPLMWKDKSTYGTYSYRMYKVTNIMASYLVIFFKDSDYSGGLSVVSGTPTDVPVYYMRMEMWTNQTAFSNDFNIYKGSFNLSVSGDEAGEFKPWLSLDFGDAMSAVESFSEFPYDWYFVSDVTNYIRFFIWRDSNGDGIVDDGEGEVFIGYPGTSVSYDQYPLGVYNQTDISYDVSLQRQVISGTNGSVNGYDVVIHPYDTNSSQPLYGFVGGHVVSYGLGSGNESYTLTNYWNVNSADTNNHCSAVFDGSTFTTNIIWTNQNATDIYLP